MVVKRCAARIVPNDARLEDGAASAGSDEPIGLMLARCPRPRAKFA